MNTKDQKILSKLLQEILELDSSCKIEQMSQENCPKWDSLAQMSMIAILEKQFSINISISDFDKLTSYSSIQKMLEEKGF